MIQANTGLKLHDSTTKTSQSEQWIRNTLLFWALHIPLGLILYYLPSQLSTMHGLVILAIGVLLAVSKQPLERVAYVAAYIMGAEVLWRMTQADLFWEFGKYSASLIFILALFRNRNTKFPVMPILSFLFLLPAILPTLIDTGWSAARDEISFNLSGHLALTLAACYFSQITFSRRDTITMLTSLIAPIISTASIILVNLLSSDKLIWGTESNFAASAGFGPNQVSIILGLGFAACIVMLLEIKRIRSLMSVVLIVLAMWFIGQAFLTFARGGVYSGLIAALIGFAFYLRENKFKNIRGLFLIVGLVSAAIYFLLPVLNDITAGRLGARFSDLNTSHRNEVAALEFDVFLENPLTGVGVGQSRSISEDTLGISYAAHTEYTRLLSDHGLLGIFSLVLLMGALLQKFFNPELKNKGLVAFALVWFGLTLTHSAMRLLAPSYMAGLVFVKFSEAEE